MKISFNYAWAYFDANGSHCDNDFLEHCDTYVRLLINGKKVFQTKTVPSQNFAQIYQTYVSDTPIPKNSEIIIEMWDYDRFTPDDFMSSWILNPEKDFGSGGTTLYDNRHKDGKQEHLKSEAYQYLGNADVILILYSTESWGIKQNAIDFNAEWLDG